MNLAFDFEIDVSALITTGLLIFLTGSRHFFPLFNSKVMCFCVYGFTSALYIISGVGGEFWLGDNYFSIDASHALLLIQRLDCVAQYQFLILFFRLQIAESYSVLDSKIRSYLTDWKEDLIYILVYDIIILIV